VLTCDQASRYDPHNVAVRAAAGDRVAAQASLRLKIGHAAATMNPRSLGPAGTAALRAKGLPPGDFKYLAMRCLNLELNDAELSEAVFEFGDAQGLVDGMKFMVRLMKLGKAAKVAAVRKNAAANEARRAGVAAREEARAEHMLANKFTRKIDFNFAPEVQPGLGRLRAHVCVCGPLRSFPLRSFPRTPSG